MTVGECRIATVEDVAIEVSVGDRIRQSGTPEHLSGKFPAIDRPLLRAAFVERRIKDKVTIYEVTDVVIRVAIVRGTQVDRVDLAKNGISVGEDAAIGVLVDVVRPSVVDVAGDPLRKLFPQAEGHTVVIRNRSGLGLRNRPVGVDGGVLIGTGPLYRP